MIKIIKVIATTIIISFCCRRDSSKSSKSWKKKFPQKCKINFQVDLKLVFWKVLNLKERRENTRRRIGPNLAREGGEGKGKYVKGRLNELIKRNISDDGIYGSRNNRKSTGLYVFSGIIFLLNALYFKNSVAVFISSLFHRYFSITCLSQHVNCLSPPFLRPPCTRHSTIAHPSM